MKIIIVHGDHVVNSRKRFSKIIDEIKSREWEIRRINHKNNIQEQFLSVSLFKEKLLYVIEDPLKLVPKDLKWLNQNKKKIEGNLLIYYQGFLPKRIINLIPGVDKIEEFKLQKLIWSFLDSIYPGNSKQIITKLHEVVENEPEEFVFSLIVGRIKELYWILIDEKSLNYPSWRLTRLKSQSKKFSKTLLKEIINDLAKIDIKVKTTRENLPDALDLLIVSKLE